MADTQPHAVPGATLRGLTVTVKLADDTPVPDMEIWVKSTSMFGVLGRTDSLGQTTGYVKDGSYRVMVLVNENYWQTMTCNALVNGVDKSVSITVEPVGTTSVYTGIAARIESLESRFLQLRDRIFQKLSNSDMAGIVRDLRRDIADARIAMQERQEELAGLIQTATTLSSRYPDQHFGAPVDDTTDLPDVEDAVPNQIIPVIGRVLPEERGLYIYNEDLEQWVRLYKEEE